jgi:hypothetical protein
MNDPLEIEEDAGVLVLKSVKEYLQPRIDADRDEQLTGECEAGSILDDMLDKISLDYQCHFCGVCLDRKGRYCSRNCWKADAEGY